MKNFALLSGLSFAFLVATPIVSPTPACAQTEPGIMLLQTAQLAPADSYFGRFRMSILGIRNAIKDISLRIESASSGDLASSLYQKLTLVEDAVLDLKDQYPQDSWLPQLGLSLAQTFAQMSYPGAQVHANDNLDWVITQYPTTNAALIAVNMRRIRLQPVVTMDVPIEPTLPSYAVPYRH